MGVTPRVLAEHLPGLVVETVAGAWIGREDGDGRNVAH